MGEMIIMETELMLMKQELDGMNELFDQYKKEYFDLCNKTGLAKVMHRSEIAAAKTNLQNHIKQLEKDMGALHNKILKLQEEKDAKEEKEVE